MNVYLQTQKTIDKLIIFDRINDMYTPSLYEKTYEGLLSEVFSIQNNCVSGSIKSYLMIKDPFITGIKSKLNNTDIKDSKVNKFLISEEDTFYNGICTKEIYDVGDIFKVKANKIEEVYAKLKEKNSTNLETKLMMEIVKETKVLKSEEANLNSQFKFTEKIVNKFVIEKNDLIFYV